MLRAVPYHSLRLPQLFLHPPIQLGVFRLPLEIVREGMQSRKERGDYEGENQQHDEHSPSRDAVGRNNAVLSHSSGA